MPPPVPDHPSPSPAPDVPPHVQTAWQPGSPAYPNSNPRKRTYQPSQNQRIAKCCARRTGSAARKTEKNSPRQVVGLVAGSWEGLAQCIRAGGWDHVHRPGFIERKLPGGPGASGLGFVGIRRPGSMTPVQRAFASFNRQALSGESRSAHPCRSGPPTTVRVILDPLAPEPGPCSTSRGRSNHPLPLRSNLYASGRTDSHAPSVANAGSTVRVHPAERPCPAVLVARIRLHPFQHRATVPRWHKGP